MTIRVMTIFRVTVTESAVSTTAPSTTGPARAVAVTVPVLRHGDSDPDPAGDRTVTGFQSR